MLYVSNELNSEFLTGPSQKHILRERQKHYFGLIDTKICKTAWLHFTNNNFPTPTSVEEVLDKLIFLNPRIKLDFSFDNPYFYCIPPRNISDKITIIRQRHLCRFLQPSLFSSKSFEEKLGFPTANHKSIYKYNMDFDWKHLLRTKISQKFLLKTFYYNNKDNKKVKDSPKLSNKEIYFILQFSSTK